MKVLNKEVSLGNGNRAKIKDIVIVLSAIMIIGQGGVFYKTQQDTTKKVKVLDLETKILCVEQDTARGIQYARGTQQLEVLGEILKIVAPAKADEIMAKAEADFQKDKTEEEEKRTLRIERLKRELNSKK